MPGPKIRIPLSGYERSYSEQERIQIFKKLSWDDEVEILRNYIETLWSKRKVVLVFHSFGTLRAAYYLHKYKDDHRITGIIDLGGAPIRFYPMLGKFIQFCQALDD